MATALKDLGSTGIMSGSPDATTDRPGAPIGYAPLPGAGQTAFADPRIGLWVKRCNEFDEFARLFQPDWIRYWRYFRAWRQPLTEPIDWWRANEVIPTAFKIIETLVPKYLFGMFDSPDWFTVKGQEPMDEVWELAIESLLKEQVEEMKLIPEVIEALKYCAIMGHVWGKVVWKEEWQQRQVIQPKMQIDPDFGIMTGSGMQKTLINDKVTDRPHFTWCALDRIKTATDGTNVWFLEEIKTTYDALVEEDKNMGGGLYQNLNRIVGETSASMTFSPQYQEPQNTEGFPQYYVEHKDGIPVTLWQCWGWVPERLRPPGGGAWRLTVIANKGTIIRDVDAPTPDGKPPYFGVKWIPIPGRLFGESILRYIGPLADQQTRLANHRLDEVMLNVWGQLIINSASGIINNEMLFQPGGALFVPGKPQEFVMPLPRTPVRPETYKEDEYRQIQAEHVSGATDLLQGLNQTDRSTAREIDVKISQAGMRVTAGILWLEETFKKPLMTSIYKWLQMRMPAEKVQRVLASDGVIYDVPMDITNLQVPVDIVISGGLLGMSKQTRIQDFTEMIQLGANPLFAPYLRPGAILQDYYREKGRHDVSRYVKSDEEIMAAQMGMAPGGPEAGLGSGVAPADEAGPSATGVPSGGNGVPAGTDVSMPSGGTGGGVGPAGPAPPS